MYLNSLDQQRQTISSGTEILSVAFTHLIPLVDPSGIRIHSLKKVYGTKRYDEARNVPSGLNFSITWTTDLGPNSGILKINKVHHCSFEIFL